jgi:hypothetical protein
MEAMMIQIEENKKALANIRTERVKRRKAMECFDRLVKELEARQSLAA